jgi:hypothetical protein
MASAADHDDTMPEETQGYKLSQPKQSLAEYQQMGKDTSIPAGTTCITFEMSLSPCRTTALGRRHDEAELYAPNVVFTTRRTAHSRLTNQGTASTFLSYQTDTFS